MKKIIIAVSVIITSCSNITGEYSIVKSVKKCNSYPNLYHTELDFTFSNQIVHVRQKISPGDTIYFSITKP